MSVELPAPRNISPLIRAGRWAFFLGGVVYGYTKLNRLREKDAPLRKAEIERRTKEHIRQEKEKEVQYKETMNELAKTIGIVPKSA